MKKILFLALITFLSVSCHKQEARTASTEQTDWQSSDIPLFTNIHPLDTLIADWHLIAEVLPNEDIVSEVYEYTDGQIDTALFRCIDLHLKFFYRECLVADTVLSKHDFSCDVPADFLVDSDLFNLFVKEVGADAFSLILTIVQMDTDWGYDYLLTAQPHSGISITPFFYDEEESD